ncbi:hypothetical protein LZ023_40800 (plasmid) [Pseudomonas silvicola]|nr:hypothetical protein LZ023_41075 [Pseudomonas silvicola]WAH62275.1 hypothetical protein LZ023_40800 [Pseudomonas silvicola]
MKKIALRVSTLMNQVALYMAALLLAPVAMAANSDVDVGGSSSGPLQMVSDFFQELVDWLSGPGVILVVFISCVGAIALWVAAPKQGSTALAWLLRAIVGGIVLFNIALLLSWLQGF